MIIKLVFSIEMTYFFSGRDSVPQGQRHRTQGHQAREHSVVQGRGGSVSVQSNSMKIRARMYLCVWVDGTSITTNISLSLTNWKACEM